MNPIKMRRIKVKILLVEDNRSISKALLFTLKSNGHSAVLCENYESALAKSGEDFDLFIFDVTLPDGNGFELYENASKYNGAPVIFLTAMDDEDSIVKGFDLGAADYITKPFSTRELLARIRRFDKKDAGTDSTLRAGDISLDPDSRTVKVKDEPAELTALEYRILLMLMQNVGKVVTRERIFEKIWDIAGNYVNDNTLTVYIKRIRKKLGTDQIKTIKGIGYRLEEK